MLTSLTIVWLMFGCGGSDDTAKTEKAAKREHAPAGKSERKEARKEDRREGKGDLKPPTTPLPKVADPCGEWAETGAFSYAFTFDGQTYEVPVYIGASKGPRDMVVLLHGGKGSAPSILKKSRFHTKAMEEGFVAVAPDATDLAGTGQRWNTGKFDKELEERLGPNAKVRDDVKFLDAMTAALRKDVCANQVLAVGFSSGGQMTHSWACKGEQVDALMSAAGELLVPDRMCNRATPVLGLVGTEDDVYTRGPNENDPTQPSAPETVAIWAKQNGCDDTPPSEKRVDDATCFTYNGCKVPTQLCVIQDLPHAYPAPWNEDEKACAFNATEYGWEWYRKARK